MYQLNVTSNLGHVFYHFETECNVGRTSRRRFKNKAGL